MDVFADSPLLVIFLVSVAALSAASEIGHRLGLRVAGEANVLTLEAAMLGLLALMLSFTFAMAVTRFDARRDAVLKEANAIGTAALRARLLPPPHDAESLRLLRDYVSAGRRETRAGAAGAGRRDRSIERDSGTALATGQVGRGEGQRHGSDRPLHPGAQRNVRRLGKPPHRLSQSRAEYRLVGALRHRRRRDRLCGIRERDRKAALEVAGICHEPPGRFRYPADSGHRPAHLGIHFRQSAADGRHGQRRRRLLDGIRKRRAATLAKVTPPRDAAVRRRGWR